MARLTFFSALALLAANVLAQTETSCQPLNSTCPADAALGTTFSQTFGSTMTEFDPNYFNVTAGSKLIGFNETGATLAITKQGDSVTIETNFYIMWGRAEIEMAPAAGQGIISSFILLSDDLDEIDWEIIGNNNTGVENNYYGWGNLSQRNAQYEDFSNAPGQFHTYAVDWNQERLEYIIDNQTVRSVPYAPPGQYPQTPMRVKFGIWAAGSPDEPKGTQEWAGGVTNFGDAPFFMLVKSLKVTDGTTNVTSYSYGDHSGSYTSIKSVAGQSEAFQVLNHLTAWQQAESRWSGLSTGAKVGIACGVLGAVALLFIGFLFYCCGQRRRGHRDRLAADKEWDANQNELMEYRSMMTKGAFAQSNLSPRPDGKF